MSLSHDGYFATRFAPDPNRPALWRHLTRYLTQYIPRHAAVLELGAGYCYFINNIPAARRVAVDVGEQVIPSAASGVEAFRADVLSFLPSLPDRSFDFVFASNLLEHFEWTDLNRMIGDIHRVLTPRGRLCLIQPNFRIAAARYFDDYTHRTIFTDVSLTDWLAASGFDVVRCIPRFLPLTVHSPMAAFTFLVPLYLQLPWRPFAGQMFALAERRG